MSRNDMEREISDWRKFGDDAEKILRNILNQKVSYTMTEHRAAEIVAENNRTLALMMGRITEIMAEHVRKSGVAA